MPLSSPGASSSRDVIEIPGEALRVCVDTCALMTCEHLREGLRTEGLMTSGVKEDLSAAWSKTFGGYKAANRSHNETAKVCPLAVSCSGSES